MLHRYYLCACGFLIYFLEKYFDIVARDRSKSLFVLVMLRNVKRAYTFNTSISTLCWVWQLSLSGIRGVNRFVARAAAVEPGSATASRAGGSRLVAAYYGSVTARPAQLPLVRPGRLGPCGAATRPRSWPRLPARVRLGRVALVQRPWLGMTYARWSHRWEQWSAQGPWRMAVGLARPRPDGGGVAHGPGVAHSAWGSGLLVLLAHSHRSCPWGWEFARWRWVSARTSLGRRRFGSHAHL